MYPQHNKITVQYSGQKGGKCVAQKNASPTKEQARMIKKNGLAPELWVVIRDLEHSLIIKGRITGEFKLINK